MKEEFLYPEKLLNHAKIKAQCFLSGKEKPFKFGNQNFLKNSKCKLRKKANLNRASLKWESQFKKEGK